MPGVVGTRALRRARAMATWQTNGPVRAIRTSNGVITLAAISRRCGQPGAAPGTHTVPAHQCGRD